MASSESLQSSSPFKNFVGKVRAVIVHPFIFAALPVVLSFAESQTDVLITDTFNGLLVTETVVIILWLAFALIFRNAYKSAAAASILISWLFLFRPFYAILAGLKGASPSGWVPASSAWLFILLWIVLAILLVAVFVSDRVQIFKLKIEINQVQFGNNLNLVAAAVLLLNVIPLASREIEHNRISAKYIAELSQPFLQTRLNNKSAGPDVYYIILDAYCHSLTLKERWNYDNSDFTQFLKEQGFYVVPHAYANYYRTAPSLASSLNMSYLNSIPKEYRFDADMAGWLYARLVQNSNVVRLFRRLNYKFVNVCGDGVGVGTDNIPQADINIRQTLNNVFVTRLLMLTPLLATECYCPLLRNAYARTRLFLDENLPAVASVPGPKFVLIHEHLPHPPYIFGANGEELPLSIDVDDEMGNGKLYVDQVTFTNKKVKQWLSRLKDLTHGKAVIIVQGDHGPWFWLPPSRATEYYDQRMRILNALFLPDLKKTGLYSDISPVNTFRLVFNDYFGANLPLLPDRAFCIDLHSFESLGGRNNRWTDVTKELTF